MEEDSLEIFLRNETVQKIINREDIPLQETQTQELSSLLAGIIDHPDYKVFRRSRRNFNTTFKVEYLNDSDHRVLAAALQVNNALIKRSFGLRVGTLCEATDTLSAQQKEALTNAIIELLDKSLKALLTVENIRESGAFLVEAIAKKYPDARDQPQAFLDALANHMGESTYKNLNIPDNTPQDLEDLASYHQQRQTLQTILLQGTLQLVKKEAGEYVRIYNKKYPERRLTIDDFNQELTSTLFRAALNFKGINAETAKFSTYFVACTKQALSFMNEHGNFHVQLPKDRAATWKSAEGPSRLKRFATPISLDASIEPFVDVVDVVNVVEPPPT